jgi:O-antigen ligase
MEIFMSLLGVFGTFCIVSMYFAIQIEKISVNNPVYSWINLIGALFLLISISYDFDIGDLGGVLIEAIWIVVSIFGLIKFYNKEKQNDRK